MPIKEYNEHGLYLNASQWAVLRVPNDLLEYNMTIKFGITILKLKLLKTDSN